MGYDERHQSSSSGALVAVIGVGLVLAILAIIAVAAVGLFSVRASTQQAQAVAIEQRVIAEAHRWRPKHSERKVSPSWKVAETPGSRLHIEVTIDREGNMSVDGEMIGLDELQAKLVKLKDDTSNAFSVHIDADPECPVKHVVLAVDVCEEVGDIDYRIMSSDGSGVYGAGV